MPSWCLLARVRCSLAVKKAVKHPAQARRQLLAHERRHDRNPEEEQHSGRMHMTPGPWLEGPGCSSTVACKARPMRWTRAQA